jgi:hypothetical protein
MTETMSNFRWLIEFNSVPAAPYSEGDPPVW